jgi:hypothetical protein
MASEVVSVILLIGIGAADGAAGYVTRIVQKVEDRRDAIHLAKLPAVYSSLRSFSVLSNLFMNGAPLNQFVDKLGKINENLSEQTFAGEIILFQKDIHDMLLAFYPEFTKLKSVLDTIAAQNNPNDPQIAVIRQLFLNGGVISGANPRNVADSATSISDVINSKLKKYKQLSLLLLVIIAILGAVAAALEFLTSKTT